jgi:hypothetical protein
MQTEEKRTCTGCGAANTPEATHCWQCFAAFAVPVPPVPDEATAGPPRFRPGFAPPAPVTPLPVARSGSTTSGASWVLRSVIGLIAAFAAYMGVQRVLMGGLEMPESVAGVTRMHDAATTDFEEQMQAEADRFDMDVEAAAFGTIGAPDFLLVVVNGSSSDSTDEMFDEFVSGITEGGATVDDLTRKGELDGASYRCVGAEAVGTGIGTCMWRADDHAGFVLDLDSDTRSTEILMQTIYRELTA